MVQDALVATTLSITPIPSCKSLLAACHLTTCLHGDSLFETSLSTHRRLWRIPHLLRHLHNNAHAPKKTGRWLSLTPSWRGVLQSGSLPMRHMILLVPLSSLSTIQDGNPRQGCNGSTTIRSFARMTMRRSSGYATSLSDLRVTWNTRIIQDTEVQPEILLMHNQLYDQQLPSLNCPNIKGEGSLRCLSLC